MTDKHVVCDLVLGLLDLSIESPPEAEWVKNAFAENMPLAELAEKNWNARLRLADRLNTDIEDADLTEMVDGYERMQRFLMLKMFDYGYQAAQMPPDGADEK